VFLNSFDGWLSQIFFLSREHGICGFDTASGCRIELNVLTKRRIMRRHLHPSQSAFYESCASPSAALQDQNNNLFELDAATKSTHAIAIFHKWHKNREEKIH
jgi:hypothetical protein